jgi:membrane-associated phospholipid phosphatase
MLASVSCSAIARGAVGNSMHLFGNLGHVVILGPLALAAMLYLFAIGARRDAYAFAAALIACLATTLFAKLFFDVCGERAPVLDIESPSGHESFSAVVYGCLAVLVATGRPQRHQIPVYCAAALLILLIGVARVVSYAHTPQDVVFGLLIGVSAAILFRRLRGEPQPMPVPWRAIAFLSPFTLFLTFGALLFLRNWTPEYFIGAGRQIGVRFGLCI